MIESELMDINGILTGFISGILTGIIYFYGLWFTVRKLPGVKRKGMLLLGSFIIRLCLVLAVFYAVSGGGLQSLLACFAGFILVRILSVTRVKGMARRKKENNAAENAYRQREV